MNSSLQVVEEETVVTAKEPVNQRKRRASAARAVENQSDDELELAAPKIAKVDRYLYDFVVTFKDGLVC